MSFSLFYLAISWYLVLGPSLCLKNSLMGLKKVPKKYHQYRIPLSVHIAKNANLVDCKNAQNYVLLSAFVHFSHAMRFIITECDGYCKSLPYSPSLVLLAEFHSTFLDRSDSGGTKLDNHGKLCNKYVKSNLRHKNAISSTFRKSFFRHTNCHL